MTKQEFAIKLLFWLMPWPLSKAFPGLILHILTGPAAQTPIQWAQAAYDSLVKYLSDASAYAQSLLSIVDHIKPIDELTQAAANLSAAIENATSLMRDLAEIMANFQDFTPDQISQAFQDAINSLDYLTSAIDELLQGIEAISAQDRPEIPPPVYIPPEELPEIPPVDEIPPEPPPYISPFPPLYPGMPGQGLTSPIYIPSNLRPRERWISYFDNTYWDPLATNWSWDGTKWVANPATWYPKLCAIGTWPSGFRPTKVRIAFTGSPDYMRVADGANFGHYINASYTSGTEVDLDWTDQGAHVMTDIYGLTVGFMASATRTITNIEFYEE